MSSCHATCKVLHGISTELLLAQVFHFISGPYRVATLNKLQKHFVLNAHSLPLSVQNEIPEVEKNFSIRLVTHPMELVVEKFSSISGISFWTLNCHFVRKPNTLGHGPKMTYYFILAQASLLAQA